MLGKEGFAKLQSSWVTVFGLGGVGSHATMALARSGIGHLRIVDFDVVTWSSLNRHAVALPADVDQPKAQVVARTLRALRPDMKLEAVEGFLDAGSADELLIGDGRPDVIIDAIDSLSPKVSLLRRCVELELPVVSSMGASARTDPTKIRVGPIEETTVCPLAKVVRKRLRRQGVSTGITAVYSVERGRDPLPPPEDEPPPHRGRVRNRLPSMATLPAIFGNAIAGEAIATLTDL